MTPSIPALRPVARGAAALLLASLMGSALAQGATPPPGAADVAVARLGTSSVSQSEVERFLQSLPEADRAAARADKAGVEAWMRQRLASDALLREATAKHWADRPEIRSRIDAAQREIAARIVGSTYLESVAQLPAAYPSDAELTAAYAEAKSGLMLPAAFRLSQIYLAVPAGADAAAVGKVRDDAKRLAVQARQGDFAALARSNSQDTASAARGGDVGLLPLAQMLPEMREPVSRLKPGQVSEPLQSEAGFHIVKLVETQAARAATLDEVRPRLRQALRDQRQQDLVRDYLARLAPASGVAIDSAALDAALQRNR